MVCPGGIRDSLDVFILPRILLAAGENDHGEYRLPLTISLMTTAGAVQ